ncbi:MAG: hypothetical protein AAGA21_18595 [Pseudomonadota bacterium]
MTHIAWQLASPVVDSSRTTPSSFVSMDDMFGRLGGRLAGERCVAAAGKTDLFSVADIDHHIIS